MNTMKLKLIIDALAARAESCRLVNTVATIYAATGIPAVIIFGVGKALGVHETAAFVAGIVAGAVFSLMAADALTLAALMVWQVRRREDGREMKYVERAILFAALSAANAFGAFVVFSNL